LLDLGEEGGDGAFSGARGVVRNEARTNARTPTRSRSNRKRTLFSLRNEALRLEKMGAISARSAASLPAVCGGGAVERGGVSQLKPRRRRKVTEARDATTHLDRLGVRPGSLEKVAGAEEAVALVLQGRELLGEGRHVLGGSHRELDRRAARFAAKDPKP